MKKLTSILLFVAMILTFAVVGVSAAAGNDGSITVVADKTQVAVGDQVVFTVKANAKTPVGSVDLRVVLPEGLELVSGEVLVQQSQFMMSMFNQAEMKFGCGMTMTGVTGEFDLFKFTAKATANGDYSVTVSMSALDEGIGNVIGDGKLDFGTIEAVNVNVHTCVFDQQSTDEKFLKSAADCKNAAVYYKSCTCGEKGTETFVSGTALGHTMTKTDAKDATCTAAGNVEYYTCSTCKKLFLDEAGNTETTADAVVKAQLSHTFDKEVEDAKYLKNDADCVTAKTYFKSCACGKASDSLSFSVGEALGHTMTKYDEKASTCTEKGNEEYYACETCKKLFEDENGDKETFADFVVIAKKPHTYNEKKVSASEAGHTFLCDVCDEPALELVPHADADGDNKCDECEYDMPVAPSSSSAAASSSVAASSSSAAASTGAASSNPATSAPASSAVASSAAPSASASTAAPSTQKPAPTSQSPVTGDAMTLWTLFAVIAVLSSVVGIAVARKNGSK